MGRCDFCGQFFKYARGLRQHLILNTCGGIARLEKTERMRWWMKEAIESRKRNRTPPDLQPWPKR